VFYKIVSDFELLSISDECPLLIVGPQKSSLFVDIFESIEKQTGTSTVELTNQDPAVSANPIFSKSSASALESGVGASERPSLWSFSIRYAGAFFFDSPGPSDLNW